MIGVLALQGDFELHEQRIRSCGSSVLRVTRREQLSEIDGIIIPGGESTSLLRLLGPEFRDALAAAISSGLPAFGTCAGLILLARRVENPAQESLGILDITVSRNAYGRQTESFIDRELRLTDAGQAALRAVVPPQARNGMLEGVFIRAPRILDVGPAAVTLAVRGTEPVLVQQGHVLGAAFHPELCETDSGVHQLFISLVSSK